MDIGKEKMNVCVFGLWHLGLVTSACLAKLDHTVVGLDFNREIVRGLQNGKAPLFEPGLNELTSENMQAGRLSFTHEPRKALKTAQAVWLAFDTPINDNDKSDILFEKKVI